eukprot:gene12355-8482_t
MGGLWLLTSSTDKQREGKKKYVLDVYQRRSDSMCRCTMHVMNQEDHQYALYCVSILFTSFFFSFLAHTFSLCGNVVAERKKETWEENYSERRIKIRMLFYAVDIYIYIYIYIQIVVVRLKFIITTDYDLIVAVSSLHFILLLFLLHFPFCAVCAGVKERKGRGWVRGRENAGFGLVVHTGRRIPIIIIIIIIYLFIVLKIYFDYTHHHLFNIHQRKGISSPEKKNILLIQTIKMVSAHRTGPVAFAVVVSCVLLLVAGTADALLLPWPPSAKGVVPEQQQQPASLRAYATAAQMEMGQVSDDSDEDLLRSFEAFKKQFGKQYDSPEEEEVRFGVFKDNMNRLYHLRSAAKSLDTPQTVAAPHDKEAAAAASDLGSLNFGVTPFFDLSSEEFESDYLQSGRSYFSARVEALRVQFSALQHESAGEIPTSGTSRETKMHPMASPDAAPMTVVLPQKIEEKETEGGNEEPSSVPFPELITMDRFLAMHQLQRVEDLRTPPAWDWREHGAVTRVKNQGRCGSCWAFSTIGNIEGQWALAGHPLTAFSEQYLTSCDTVDVGCEGGLMETALDYILVNNSGVVFTESSYPYASANGTAPACLAHGVKPFPGGRIDGRVFIQSNEDLIEAWLAAYGPLSIAVDATIWSFYVGGILPFCTPIQLNHGVLLVGYNNSAPVPYWIVKNSWGPSWGEQGYIRIKKGSNECLMKEYVVSAYTGDAAPTQPPTSRPTTTTTRRPRPTTTTTIVRFEHLRRYGMHDDQLQACGGSASRCRTLAPLTGSPAERQQQTKPSSAGQQHAKASPSGWRSTRCIRVLKTGSSIKSMSTKDEVEHLVSWLYFYFYLFCFCLFVPCLHLATLIPYNPYHSFFQIIKKKKWSEEQPPLPRVNRPHTDCLPPKASDREKGLTCTFSGHGRSAAWCLETPTIVVVNRRAGNFGGLRTPVRTSYSYPVIVLLRLILFFFLVVCLFIYLFGCFLLLLLLVVSREFMAGLESPSHDRGSDFTPSGVSPSGPLAAAEVLSAPSTGAFSSPGSSAHKDPLAAPGSFHPVASRRHDDNGIPSFHAYRMDVGAWSDQPWAVTPRSRASSTDGRTSSAGLVAGDPSQAPIGRFHFDDSGDTRDRGAPIEFHQAEGMAACHDLTFPTPAQTSLGWHFVSSTEGAAAEHHTQTPPPLTLMEEEDEGSPKHPVQPSLARYTFTSRRLARPAHRDLVSKPGGHKACDRLGGPPFTLHIGTLNLLYTPRYRSMCKTQLVDVQQRVEGLSKSFRMTRPPRRGEMKVTLMALQECPKERDDIVRALCAELPGARLLFPSGMEEGPGILFDPAYVSEGWPSAKEERGATRERGPPADIHKKVEVEKGNGKWATPSSPGARTHAFYPIRKEDGFFGTKGFTVARLTLRAPAPAPRGRAAPQGGEEEVPLLLVSCDLVPSESIDYVANSLLEMMDVVDHWCWIAEGDCSSAAHEEGTGSGADTSRRSVPIIIAGNMAVDLKAPKWDDVMNMVFPSHMWENGLADLPFTARSRETDEPCTSDVIFMRHSYREFTTHSSHEEGTPGFTSHVKKREEEASAFQTLCFGRELVSSCEEEEEEKGGFGAPRHSCVTWMRPEACSFLIPHQRAGRVLAPFVSDHALCIARAEVMPATGVSQGILWGPNASVLNKDPIILVLPVLFQQHRVKGLHRRGGGFSGYWGGFGKILTMGRREEGIPKEPIPCLHVMEEGSFLLFLLLRIYIYMYLCCFVAHKTSLEESLFGCSYGKMVKWFVKHHFFSVVFVFVCRYRLVAAETSLNRVELEGGGISQTRPAVPPATQKRSSRLGTQQWRFDSSYFFPAPAGLRRRLITAHRNTNGMRTGSRG